MEGWKNGRDGRSILDSQDGERQDLGPLGEAVQMHVLLGAVVQLAPGAHGADGGSAHHGGVAGVGAGAHGDALDIHADLGALGLHDLIESHVALGLLHGDEAPLGIADQLGVGAGDIGLAVADLIQGLEDLGAALDALVAEVAPHLRVSGDAVGGHAAADDAGVEGDVIVGVAEVIEVNQLVDQFLDGAGTLLGVLAGVGGDALHGDLGIVDAGAAQDHGALVGAGLHVEDGVLALGDFLQLVGGVGIGMAGLLIAHEHDGDVVLHEVQGVQGLQGVEGDGDAALHIQHAGAVGDAVLRTEGTGGGGALGEDGVHVADDHDILGVRGAALPLGQDMGGDAGVIQVFHVEVQGLQGVAHDLGHGLDALGAVSAAVDVDHLFQGGDHAVIVAVDEGVELFHNETSLEVKCWVGSGVLGGLLLVHDEEDAVDEDAGEHDEHGEDAVVDAQLAAQEEDGGTGDKAADAGADVLAGDVHIDGAEEGGQDVVEGVRHELGQVGDHVGTDGDEEGDHAGGDEDGAGGADGADDVALVGAGLHAHDLLGHGGGGEADVAHAAGQPADVGTGGAQGGEVGDGLHDPGDAVGGGHQEPELADGGDVRHLAVADAHVNGGQEVGDDGEEHGQTTDLDKFLIVHIGTSLSP